MARLLFPSPLVRLLGVVDLVALIVIASTLIYSAILSGGVPWMSYVGGFYLFLWINKAFFTAGITGAAFPAIFGLTETGTFSINPLWYVVSLIVLCGVVIVIITTSLGDDMYMMAAISSAIACGRATIPPLMVGHALASRCIER